MKHFVEQDGRSMRRLESGRCFLFVERVGL
jgi:hypothetical protein